MKILLRDIRDYISKFNIAVDNNCYCGKLEDKKQNSIGIYPLKNRRVPQNTIGGDKNKSYYAKGISILIHWNKSPTDSEKVSNILYEKLKDVREADINGHTIKFIQMQQEEPIWIGTDDKGIYEYVIECLFFMAKEIDGDEKKRSITKS